jgi:serine/threonine protein kinase
MRSDSYSLGTTLWEMVTGDLPFKAPVTELVYQHQHLPIPLSFTAYVPPLPKEKLLGIWQPKLLSGSKPGLPEAISTTPGIFASIIGITSGAGGARECQSRSTE